MDTATSRCPECWGIIRPSGHTCPSHGTSTPGAKRPETKAERTERRRLGVLAALESGRYKTYGALAAEVGLSESREADYRNMHLTRTQWALGFGVGYIDTKTGYNYLIPVPIIDYSCMVEGKVYRG